MNTNYRELVEEFPKAFSRYKTRDDDDIIDALCDIDEPHGEYFLNKDELVRLLDGAKQGDSIIVKGYLFVELGRDHTPIILWCNVDLHNLDMEEGRFEYECADSYLGWDYYVDVKKETRDYLYPQADYLEFMK